MHAQYEDHMGSDLSVVNAARVSFSKRSDWEYLDPQMPEFSARRLKAGDVKLLNTLATGLYSADWERIKQEATAINADSEEAAIKELVYKIRGSATHWTPFTHTCLQITASAPVPIRTQCFKHKTGFTENEESRRYITSRPVVYMPKEFRSAPENKKQGSGGTHYRSDYWLQQYDIKANDAVDTYIAMVEDGVCTEQARFILPQGVEVNWWWTGNIFAFANFYNKRSDGHAQSEIQQLAELIAPIAKAHFPESWKALTNS